jgi:uncharacterized protein YcbX
LNSIKIQDIYIYPVKSLGGFRVEQALLEHRGFQHDRRWMLVDENNLFISQREIPKLVLFDVTLQTNRFKINHRLNKNSEFFLPFSIEPDNIISVVIWEDTCSAIEYSEGSKWFSEQLQINCKLVYMPETSNRYVEKKYAHNNEIVSFSDGYPVSLIGQKSLDELNEKLKTPIRMERFRPNIVVSGTYAFEEDGWKKIRINDIEIIAAKQCARCMIPSINPNTAKKEKEPNATLAKFRRHDDKIYFGQNLLTKGNGIIKCGNVIKITA